MAIKFFDTNVINADATFTFTSATTSLASFLYDEDRSTRLTSSGSNDVTDEVFTIEFASAKDIDRIHIENHNVKDGNIQYWNGAAYVDFSPAISMSSNTATDNYYEVASVSTERIRFTMNTTQTANAEKFLGNWRAMEQIGEVNANPETFKFSFEDAKVLHTTGKGRTINVTFDNTNFTAELDFSDANDTDIALFRTLKDRTDTFYIYPGGGNTTYTQEGFRIRDIYRVTFSNSFEPEIKAQILGLNTRLIMELRKS